MSTVTKIEWSDRTWSPLLGCRKVGPGCDNCYAIRTVNRLAHNPSPKVGPLYVDLTHRTDDGLDWTGKITTIPERLGDPLKWRKPQRVFVNSQSDLFHSDVPAEFIAQVFAVMALAPQHTFQVLTKRHARMRSLLSSDEFPALVRAARRELVHDPGDGISDTAAFRLLTENTEGPGGLGIYMKQMEWPLLNVWMGVSAEDQHWADIRIPALLETPAAVRWVSAEPLLGPIDMAPWLNPEKTCERCDVDCPDCPIGRGVVMDEDLDMRTGRQPLRTLSWIVAGGESGPGARPMHPRWAGGLRDQCAAAGVPFLFKQWGEWAPTPWKGEGGATHAFTGGFYRSEGRYVEGFMELGHSPTSSERDDSTPHGAQGMRRMGKKAAGRELDGRTWDQYPEVRL